MAKDTLIDDRVSTSQIKKATEALHAYESKKQAEREETELLPGRESNIWLNVAVKQVAPKVKIKPIKIPIVHPLVDPRTTSICLITKDPQREYKDLLESQNIKFISRVVGIAKLKGKFKPFEARRLLLKENGLFLADERVITLLPKLLGSKWFEAKKQPIPVCLTRKDLKSELERAISSTYMHQNNGTCTSIKVANISHTPVQIVSNITKAIPAVAAHIPGNWDNIQSLYIKTNTSVSLPIWNCDLNERWSGSAKGSDKKADEKADEPADAKGKKKEQSSKKRQIEDDSESDDDDAAEQPRKKVKPGKDVNQPAASSITKSAMKTNKKPMQPQQTSAPSTDQKSKKAAKPDASTTSETPLKQNSTKKVQQTVEPTQPKVEAKPQTKEDKGLTKATPERKRGGVMLQKKKEKILNAKAGSQGKMLKAKVLGKKALQA